MKHISIRLGEELANQVSGAMKEFGYSTKTDFIKDSIREKLKELSSERRVAQAWHKLLTAHNRAKVMKNWVTKLTSKKSIVQHRSLSLRDLVKHEYPTSQTRLVMQ
ncbi:MAG: ribbon-helix-helix domain-containing protein [archaeon]|jgi:metal-responsive CopG/Arc/MetJ family transcriptional regulator